MSESALVGAITADGTFTARYLHWTGAPTDTVAALRTIWADHFGRDTIATVTALLSHHWHRLCPTCQHHRPPAATVAVAGVGHALATEQLVVRDLVVRGHVATDAPYGDTGWMYLLDAEAQTVRVYEATVHDRWLPHSQHPLNANTGPAPTGGRYHQGDRVALEHTNDPHTRLRPGDQGTVAFDQRESSTVSIEWDSGSCLAMLLDAGDRIRLLTPNPEATTRTPRRRASPA
ncbi:DUF4314 domain-containing protein [Micromonospora sp. NBC_01813]|uniref:DUF4314 domain-containing protein n=1 Tax=Micromonospora sp. NBC_01813 TaxID=2975988 RepID=UPI002DD7A676|nr:DUF4314 domain-containing protein [Micromonospora sp. NBC_01813]WSA06988.1 DUF4314 domain-containing protein [Micromonospora sp. NBC_01813]